VGKLFDAYGPRLLLISGTFLHVFGIMMTSISHEYWHFILAQGICSAIGTSLIFNAALGSVST
jgi:nitrate/nitrite transporter NarK